MKQEIELSMLSELDKRNFISCFGDMRDERNQIRVRYPMQEVLFLVVCSVVSGYESNRAIEEFGKLKLAWLRNYFPFRNGIPFHETIGNIIGLLKTDVFESAFIKWVALQFGKDEAGLIHIDGKCISSSVDKMRQDKKSSNGGKRASLILNAYASTNNMVVAQMDISKSRDEKEGAKRLIDQLDLKGKTITGDSNFCVKAFLKQIRKEGGHYVITLKRNNPILYDIAEQYFEEYTAEQSQFQTVDRGHGRTEIRTYRSLSVDVAPHQKFTEYNGLTQFIKVERNRTELRKNKTSNEIHYYITSSNKTIVPLAESIRSHWSVENNLHWVLDVEFNEDASRKRKGNQASNFSLIRKIALNLINHNRGTKSIKAMRMACSLSDEVRQNVLGFS